MARLLEFAVRQKEGGLPKVSDILGEEVKIVSVEFLQGKVGEYAIFDIVDDEGELTRIQTTGMLVVDALKHCQAEKGFPVDVTFQRNDRTYVIE